jgi:hypothetical protein
MAKKKAANASSSRGKTLELKRKKKPKGKKTSKGGKKKGRTVLKSQKDRDDFYDNLEEEYQKDAVSTGRSDFGKLPEGKTRIRLRKFKVGKATRLFTKRTVHWGGNPNEKGPTLCPKTFDTSEKKNECAHCEMLDNLPKKKADKVGRMFARTTFLMTAIVRDDPKHGNEDTQQILDIPKTIKQEIVKVIKDDDGNFANVDLFGKKGNDLQVTRFLEKSGQREMLTGCKVAPVAKACPMGDFPEPLNLEEFVRRQLLPNAELQGMARELKMSI